jgi:hypothetical protein
MVTATATPAKGGGGGVELAFGGGGGAAPSMIHFKQNCCMFLPLHLFVI